MAKKNGKKLSTEQKVGIGVGITAAAAAAAGAFFLYGSKNAPKNRKMVKSWLIRAKSEVLEALEKAEHMTQREYEQLVDTVGGAYGMMKNVSRGEIADFKREMKGYWQQLEKSGVIDRAVEGATRGAVQEVSRQVRKKGASKKATKKTAKKSSKKTTKKATSKKAA